MSPVDFIEEKPTTLESVPFRLGNHLLERRPLVSLTPGLRTLNQLDDLALVLFGSGVPDMEKFYGVCTTATFCSRVLGKTQYDLLRRHEAIYRANTSCM